MRASPGVLSDKFEASAQKNNLRHPQVAVYVRLLIFAVATFGRTAEMMDQFRALAAASLLLALLFCPPRASAQDVSTAGSATPPANAELEVLLQARDWNRLSSALKEQPRDAAAFANRLDWLHVKIDEGAGFLVAFSYMRDLWLAGNALKVEDPKTDMRMTAGMIALYAYELVVIDGAKCEDQSAPNNRASQLLSLNPATFSFIRSRPAALKEWLIAIALALEKRTAPLRRDDDLLCRNGLDEMRAGLERGTQKEIPNAPRYYGKKVEVTTPPDWTPKFLSPETYVPIQNDARAKMREILLKLTQ